MPRYLPEYLEIDVTNLELNQIYHLSDIKLPEGVSLVALKHGHDQPVVAVNPPRAGGSGHSGRGRRSAGRAKCRRPRRLRRPPRQRRRRERQRQGQGQGQGREEGRQEGLARRAGAERPYREAAAGRPFHLCARAASEPVDEDLDVDVDNDELRFRASDGDTCERRGSRWAPRSI